MINFSTLLLSLNTTQKELSLCGLDHLLGTNMPPIPPNLETPFNAFWLQWNNLLENFSKKAYSLHCINTYYRFGPRQLLIDFTIYPNSPKNLQPHA